MSTKHCKQIIFFIAVFISILFLGCKKEKPPVGKYYATFNYKSPVNFSKNIALEIIESSEDIITINNSELLKCGKNIKGSFSDSNPSTFNIDGKWTKKLFANSYIIKGSFTSTSYSLGGPPFTGSGNFIIESDFE